MYESAFLGRWKSGKRINLKYSHSKIHIDRCLLLNCILWMKRFWCVRIQSEMFMHSRRDMAGIHLTSANIRNSLFYLWLGIPRKWETKCILRMVNILFHLSTAIKCTHAPYDSNNNSNDCSACPCAIHLICIIIVRMARKYSEWVELDNGDIPEWAWLLEISMQNGPSFAEEHSWAILESNKCHHRISLQTHVFANYHDKLLDCLFRFRHISWFRSILFPIQEFSMEFISSSKPMQYWIWEF